MNSFPRAHGAGDAPGGIRNGLPVRTVADWTEIAARSMGTADGRASARALTACRNQFRDARAVIIGNGPSLRDTDLTLLANETTFGLNRAYLMFDDLGCHTTFLVAVNELVISQVADELAQVPCQKFIGWSSRRMFRRGSPNLAYLQSRRTPGFATDARRGVWEGATVTYVAMQLAFHMGFSRVVLVGVDHNFVAPGKPHETVVSKGPDVNHFDPNYFGQGFRWQLPDLEASEYAYRLARKAYEGAGRTIVDATQGGKLDVFPKMSLRDALSL